MDAASLPLRDIHLPVPPDWWPLAPGWWLLLGFLIIAMAAGIWLRRALKYKSIKKLARWEFAVLRQNQQLSDQQKLRQASILLRRISISAFPRTDSASLTGICWLEFLDQALDDKPFSQGPVKVLLDGPYRTAVQIDLNPVFDACERWIKVLPNKKVGPYSARSENLS